MLKYLQISATNAQDPPGEDTNFLSYPPCRIFRTPTNRPTLSKYFEFTFLFFLPESEVTIGFPVGRLLGHAAAMSERKRASQAGLRATFQPLLLFLELVQFLSFSPLDKREKESERERERERGNTYSSRTVLHILYWRYGPPFHCEATDDDTFQSGSRSVGWLMQKYFPYGLERKWIEKHLSQP